MRTTIFVLLALIVSACATGPKFQDAPPPNSDKALVYFMHAYTAGTFFGCSFSVNNTEIATLQNEGYTWIYLDPGVYTFTGDPQGALPALSFDMPVLARQTYYVECRVLERVNYSELQNLIHAVPEHDARPRIARMRYKAAAPVTLESRQATKQWGSLVPDGDILAFAMCSTSPMTC